MATCDAVLKDAYDGKPLLKCDLDDEVQHTRHLDRVQNVEWSIPFLGVGITRLPVKPYSAEPETKTWTAAPDHRVTVTIGG